MAACHVTIKIKLLNLSLKGPRCNSIERKTVKRKRERKKEGGLKDMTKERIKVGKK